MKHSGLKDIVFIGLLSLILIGGYEYLEKNNWDYKTLITGDLFEQRPASTTSMGTYDDVVYIHGLGNVSQDKLENSKKIIEDYYGISCVVLENVPIENGFYLGNTGMLDVDVLFKTFDNKIKTIYVTDERLYDSQSNIEVRGMTLFFGKTMLVTTETLKTALIHEYGHTLGLDHCHNEGCVMTEGFNEELCSECINEIKFKNQKWTR